jgi:histone acetyltransferase (RNA polymerase elongator complex component)
VKKRYILPVFLPFAGCINRCVYCDQEAITGYASDIILQNAEGQINEWKARRNEWDEIAFYGGTFARLNRSLRFALYDIAAPYQIRVSTCPSSVDAEFIKEVETNISVLELGVQSLSDEVLELNRRAYSAGSVISLLRELNKLKCKITAQFMTGLYGETRELFKQSCEKLSELRVDFARIYPMLVLPGAPIAKLDFTPLEPIESLLRSAWLFISLNAINIKVIRISLPQGFGNYLGFYHHAYGDLVKTIASYANFLKGGGLIKGFNGYGGALKKIDGNFDVLDFTGLSQNVANLYSFDEWFKDDELSAFIGELLCG